jgi:hypothetical protein
LFADRPLFAFLHIPRSGWLIFSAIGAYNTPGPLNINPPLSYKIFALINFYLFILLTFFNFHLGEVPVA